MEKRLRIRKDECSLRTWSFTRCADEHPGKTTSRQLALSNLPTCAIRRVRREDGWHPAVTQRQPATSATHRRITMATVIERIEMRLTGTASKRAWSALIRTIGASNLPP